MAPTALTDDGGWCWFQDPRAVRHIGEHDRTYAGWITRGGDVEVGRYDHGAGEIRTATLHPDFEQDDHDAPALWIDAEGRLVAFYTKHAGETIRYRRGREPESVADFGPERRIRAVTPPVTYPNPRRLGDDLHLCYRNGNGSLSCVASGDGGESWGPERELVTTGGREWCVYFKLSAPRDGAVDVGLTYAEGGGHEPHRDVRHVRFDGGGLRTADGDALGDAIVFPDAPVVYDSGAGHDAWIHDCAAGPELAYAELRAEDDHAYRYARYDGGEWIDEPVADAGSHIVPGDVETYYSGGIALDPGRSRVCYASVGDSEGSELRRYERERDGEWAGRTVAGGDVQHVRPVVPRNRHDELPVLWMRGSYDHFADGAYDTAIGSGRPGGA